MLKTAVIEDIVKNILGSAFLLIPTILLAKNTGEFTKTYLNSGRIADLKQKLNIDIPDNVVIIKTEPQIKKYYSENIDSKLRTIVETIAAKQILKDKSNAVLIMPDKPGKPAAILVPEGLQNEAYLAHAVGQYKDLQSRGITTHKGFKKYYKPTVSYALSPLYKRTKNIPFYKAEINAWDKSGLPKSDTTRINSLKLRKEKYDLLRSLGYHTFFTQLANDVLIKKGDLSTAGKSMIGLGAAAAGVGLLLSAENKNLKAFHGVMLERPRKRKYKIKLPKGLKTISTEAQADKWIDDNVIGTERKQMAKKNLYKLLKDPMFAGHITPGNKNGYSAIIVPKDLKNDFIRAHEIGHQLHSNIIGAGSGKEVLKIQRPTYSKIKALFVDPKKTPMYLHEVIAWDLAGVPKDDPTRIASLKTYEIDLQMNRRKALGYLLPIVGTTVAMS